MRTRFGPARCCCGSPGGAPCRFGGCRYPDGDLLLSMWSTKIVGGVWTRDTKIIDAATLTKLESPFPVKTFSSIIPVVHTGLDCYWYLEATGGGWTWRFYLGCPNAHAGGRPDEGTRFQIAGTESSNWNSVFAQPGGPMNNGGSPGVACDPFHAVVTQKAVAPEEYSFQWAWGSWEIAIGAP